MAHAPAPARDRRSASAGPARHRWCSTPPAAPATSPTRSRLRVGELLVGSRRLSNVTAGLSQQAELWRANVSADELEGYLEYRPARRGAAPAPAACSLAWLA